jgi:hypothetical protein
VGEPRPRLVRVHVRAACSCSTAAKLASFETIILRVLCFYGGLPWRVMAQVPRLCWERPLDTISRLVLLVGMMPHCRKRSGVKISAGSVTSIDTAQRQRRRSLLGTILGCWQVRLLSCYLFVRITMILPIHPKSVISSPCAIRVGSLLSTSLAWLL